MNARPPPAEMPAAAVAAKPVVVLMSARQAVRDRLTRFATSAGVCALPADCTAEALLLVERQRPDAVLVSGDADVADAEALLAVVRRTHPYAARLVLTIATDVAGTHAALRHAHHVIHEGAVRDLAALARRTTALMRTLDDPAVRAVVGDLAHLPSVPRTYLALVDAASDPNVSMQTLVDIVQRDPGMAVKLLQLVNSAFFGRGKRIVSVSQAVNLLGLELLKGLALSAHVFAAVATLQASTFSMERFQSHSLRTARLARAFVTDAALRDTAFTAGLVLDIGQLIVALRNPEASARIAARAARERRPLRAIEREELGVGHDVIGASLLAMWGIPFAVVECVAYHHSPGRPDGETGEVQAAVHAADALLGILTCNEPPDVLDEAMIASAGLADELPRWRALAEAEAAAGA